MKILDFPQLSPEWKAAKRGLPTASRLGKAISSKNGNLLAGADDLISELIAETVCPEEVPDDLWDNYAVRRGVRLEPESRRWFEMEKDCDVAKVGLCTSDDGRYGCSPDGLIVEGGRPVAGWESKSPLPKRHFAYVRAGVLPDEYRVQVHVSLAVSDLPLWWFCSYCPAAPQLAIPVEPDSYTAVVRASIDQFLNAYAKALALFTEAR